MRKSLTICLCLALIFFARVEAKIGRGGGGGSSFRNMGSRNRIKPVPPRPNPYGIGSGYNSYSRSGIRWASFGAGMAAYGVMSSLMSRGHYHPGYYSRPDYYSRSSTTLGSLCVNNEDFNGTKFGSFYCPLPGFNPSAKYCCGSLEAEAQYCCEYFDDESRKNGVIIAVMCVIGIIVCFIGCGIRVYLIYKKKTNFPKAPSTYGQFAQVRNINRNFGPVQRNNPGLRPPSQYMPYPNAYPSQPLMSQQNDTRIQHPENMPPSYTDAVKK